MDRIENETADRRKKNGRINAGLKEKPQMR